MLTGKKLYRKTTKELVGLRVRSTVELQNRLGSVPAGALFTITGKSGGLTLKTEPCKCCGVSFFISKVPANDVYTVDGPTQLERSLGSEEKDVLKEVGLE